MPMQTYKVTTAFDTFHLRGNFAEASSSIEVNTDPDYEDNSWGPTPFQVADARHNPEVAAVMLVSYFGTEWYLDPADEHLHDEMGPDAYIREHVIESVD